MKAIKVARLIVDTKTCHLLRPQKNESGQYDVKAFYGRGNKRGWAYWDLFSASAVVKVYDALSKENRAKYESMNPLRMVDVAFKMLK